MLSEQRKQYYRVLLTRRLEELLNNGGRKYIEPDGLNEKLPDPSDRATAEYEVGFGLRMREREDGLIGKIKEALERIENGTYGICEECEEEISEGRLEARPVTTLCIECKKRQEAEEKLRGL